MLASPSALACPVLLQGILSSTVPACQSRRLRCHLLHPASSLTGPALSPSAAQCYRDLGCCSSCGNSGLPEGSLHSQPCLPWVPAWTLHTVGVYSQSRSRVPLTQKPPIVASLHPSVSHCRPRGNEQQLKWRLALHPPEPVLGILARR